MWVVDATDVTVNHPDVTVSGDGTIVLEVALVGDVYVLVSDRSVTVGGARL